MMMSLWKLMLFSVLLLNVGLVLTEDKVTEEKPAEDSDKVTDEDDDDESQKPREKIHFQRPKIGNGVNFALYFEAANDLTDKMVVSKAKKDGVEADLSKYDGQWGVEVPESSAIEGDFSLILRSKARHHAVSAKMTKPYHFERNKPFVVQYEVKFQNGMECGGAYVKLLTDLPSLDLKNFHDKTPYTIMFGPDKCGLDHKLHFIFRHKHPKTGAIEEKHAKKPKAELDSYFSDKKTHLYTLVVNPDNTFQVFVDQKLVNSGSLLEDMEPSVNPPKEIDDPKDKKPADWDERAKIPDSTAKKPDDWDETAPEYILDESAKKPDGWLDKEPLMIPDPKAVKPKDWDSEMDGEWEPANIDNPKCKDAPGCGEWKRPKKKNPKYKGKWSAPMIDNPNYKGIWKPKKISNPDFFEDKEPYLMSPIGAVGLELWSMTDGIAFDNFIIADNKKAVDDFAAATFDVKVTEERRADPNRQSVVDAIRDATNEKPWLWAVIILVIALPIVLIVAYCCMRGGGGGDSSAEYARRKKTDAPTRDDEPIPEGDEDAAEGGEAGEGEVEGESEEEEEDAPSGGGDASGPGKGSLEEDGAQSSEEESPKGEEQSEEEKEVRSSPRNRKPRARKH